MVFFEHREGPHNPVVGTEVNGTRKAIFPDLIPISMKTSVTIARL